MWCTMSELPTIPTAPAKVIDLAGTTERACAGCDGVAEFYVIVDNVSANQRLGTDLSPDEWPVNEMLCSECFRECPRVQDWSELPGVNPDE